MCIAMIKPAGVEVPSREVLEHCFKKNPDGAGLALSDGNEFHIVKGLMTFAAFEEQLEKFRASREGNLKDSLLALHFRIGTHGSKADPPHTHPFPISSNEADLHALDIKCKRIALHNGILSKYGDSYSYGKWDYITRTYIKEPEEKPRLSDTQDFIVSFVAEIQECLGEKSFFDSRAAERLVTNELGASRFTIIEPDGRFIYWGDWIKEGGMLYSNFDFRIPKPVPTVAASPANGGVLTETASGDKKDPTKEVTSTTKTVVFTKEELEAFRKEDEEYFKSLEKKYASDGALDRMVYPDQSQTWPYNVNKLAKDSGLIPLAQGEFFFFFEGAPLRIKNGSGTHFYDYKKRHLFEWDGFDCFVFITGYDSFRRVTEYMKETHRKVQESLEAQKAKAEEKKANGEQAEAVEGEKAPWAEAQERIDMILAEAYGPELSPEAFYD